MIFNTTMVNILSQVTTDSILVMNTVPIWKKKTRSGLPYWGTGNFNGIDESATCADDDLTAWEWDGNEVRLNDADDILVLIKQGLGIILSWKTQMEREYPDTAFDLLLSVDVGDVEVPPSVTLRFWAVRNGAHYVQPTAETLQKFCQPVLMEQVNYNSVK